MSRATKLSARTVKVALRNVGESSSTLTFGRRIIWSMPACAFALKLMSVLDEPAPSSKM
jgi:hypothetical protein